MCDILFCWPQASWGCQSVQERLKMRYWSFLTQTVRLASPHQLSQPKALCLAGHLIRTCTCGSTLRKERRPAAAPARALYRLSCAPLAAGHCSLHGRWQITKLLTGAWSAAAVLALHTISCTGPPCLSICVLTFIACCIRLQDEQLSEMSASPGDKKREQAHFEALQSMHGFSNASSGVCSLCHERHHDQQGCPRAPHNTRCHPQGLS